MEKEVKLLDSNTVSLDIDDSYCGHTFRITKRYFKNGEYSKDFCLSMWDDYGFDAWTNDIETLKNATSLSFDIPPYDPLYFCFLEFLGNLNEIVIDSDDVNELNKKTLTIRKKEDGEIELIYKCTLENVSACDKFNIFIKNVGFDLRSKIDSFHLDTKERLYKFFENARFTLLEEYHQISIDEYMLTRKIDNK